MRKNLILFLFVPFICSAQNANDVLTKLQKKYQTIKTISSDFTQSTVIPGDKNSFKSAGKIQFKKNNKLRIELKDVTIVTDGKTVWNFNKKQNKAVLTSYESEPSMLSLDKYIIEYPKICNVGFYGSSKSILMLKPKDKGADFKEIKIYTEKENFLTKVEVTDSNGNILTFEFSNIKFDEEISDKVFTLTIPKGANTVDLR